MLNKRSVATVLSSKEESGLWRAAADAVTANIAVLDERSEIIAVNDAWRRFALKEGGKSDCVGVNYLAVCEAAGDQLALGVANGLTNVSRGRTEEFVCEYPCHSDSEERWFALRATRAAAGFHARLIVVHQNVTARVLDQNDDRSQSLLLAEVNVSIHTTDLSKTVTGWNADAEHLFGWTAEEAIGRTMDQLMISSGRTDAEVAERIGMREWQGDLMLARKNGSTFPAHVSSRIVGDLSGAPRSTIVATVNISPR